MTKNNERLRHALHNESACNYLSLREDMSDWVITTSFYASLHFLAFKIFPFNVPALGGKTTSIESVDHYYNYNNTKKKSKHELLSNLAFNSRLTSEEVLAVEKDLSLSFTLSLRN